MKAYQLLAIDNRGDVTVQFGTINDFEYAKQIAIFLKEKYNFEHIVCDEITLDSLLFQLGDSQIEGDLTYRSSADQSEIFHI